MPRPAPSLASTIAALAALTSGPRPVWCTTATWAALGRLTQTLLRELESHVGAVGVGNAADDAGVGVATLRRWRSGAGWPRRDRDEKPAKPSDDDRGWATVSAPGVGIEVQTRPLTESERAALDVGGFFEPKRAT